jgi:hypothetical protein
MDAAGKNAVVCIVQTGVRLIKYALIRTLRAILYLKEDLYIGRCWLKERNKGKRSVRAAGAVELD